MIGKEPTFENKETPEQQLAQLLKEKGAEDSETKSLLLSWTLEQERLVDQSADRLEAAIQFNLRRARLYFEAGYLEEAFENFDDAADQARNEQRSELYQEIVNEIAKLEKSLE